MSEIGFDDAATELVLNVLFLTELSKKEKKYYTTNAGTLTW
jgi:hypothetical protein